jgi:hypothetical protein
MLSAFRRWKLILVFPVGFVVAAVAAIAVLDPGSGVGSAVDKAQIGSFSGPPTMRPEEMAEIFRPGRPWDGIGRDGSLTEEEFASFSDFSQFWIGPSFEGYNLQSIQRIKYNVPPGVPSIQAWDAITLTYGDCKPPKGQGSCPIPITIHIHPICAITPEVVAAAKGVPMRERGHAAIQDFNDGHSMLWTGDVSIELHVAGGREATARAIEVLKPLA